MKPNLLLDNCEQDIEMTFNASIQRSLFSEVTLFNNADATLFVIIYDL